MLYISSRPQCVDKQMILTLILNQICYSKVVANIEEYFDKQ